MIDVKESSMFPPVGSILAWDKNISTDELPDYFLECDGSTISDSQSIFNGQTLPDLNNTNRFLKGDSNNNNTGGSETHRHLIYTGGAVSDSGSGGSSSNGQLEPDSVYATDYANSLPPYYDVVWIMRIK